MHVNAYLRKSAHFTPDFRAALLQISMFSPPVFELDLLPCLRLTIPERLRESLCVERSLFSKTFHTAKIGVNSLLGPTRA